jgi:hypothetical protein
MATLKREDLYADVWTRPATSIAAELGLPRNTLKRICAGMDIPTPNTGYWISARHGRKRAKPDLPPPTPTTRLEWDVDLERARLRRFLKRSRLGGGEAIPAAVLPKTTAPEKRHPLVQATAAYLRHTWNPHSGKEWIERRRLRAKVGKACLDRTLLILEGVVRGVLAQGLKFGCELDRPEAQREMEKPSWQRRSHYSGACWVEAAGEQVRFSLRERMRQVKIEDPEEAKQAYRQTKDVPSGELEFVIVAGAGIDRQHLWQDRRIKRVEDSIQEIIACFLPAGESLRAERLEREARQKRYQDLETLRWHLKAQQSAEESALEKAIEAMNQHDLAERLRGFLRACEHRYAELHTRPPDPDEPAGLWLRWAALRADMMDPLRADQLPWEEPDMNRLMGRILQ